MRFPSLLLSARAAFWLSLSIGVVGCRPASERPAEMPAPKVTVSYPLQRDITDYNSYTGRTAAIDSVQVTPRVTGYLNKIAFQDGAEVAQGALLYQIDPRPYQAQYDAASAQLAQSQANLDLAQANNLRYQALAREQAGAVTPQQLDQYRAQAKQAAAAVHVAQADLATAKLNLDWTKVSSPISGLLSRTLVTRGNLVVADQTVLTNIVSQDPMYAYFDVDEFTALHLQRLVRQGQLQTDGQSSTQVPITMGLANEVGYPHAGHLDFVDNKLDTTTATLLLRGIFANPKPADGPRPLSPGMFVRIRVPIGPAYHALLVIDGAVGTDQDVKYLYVANDKDQVVRRDVTLGTLHNHLRVITKGIKARDRVIISGLQHVHPSMTVHATLKPMPTPAAETLNAAGNDAPSGETDTPSITNTQGKTDCCFPASRAGTAGTCRAGSLLADRPSTLPRRRIGGPTARSSALPQAGKGRGESLLDADNHFGTCHAS